mgnify:CR=1 FL=1
MKHAAKLLSALFVAVSLVSVVGCASGPQKEGTGEYIDDTAITATVKARMLENEDVAGTSITVETLNGTVMLSGFAKSAHEKATAEGIARKVDGVKAVLHFGGLIAARSTAEFLEANGEGTTALAAAFRRAAPPDGSSGCRPLMAVRGPERS